METLAVTRLQVAVNKLVHSKQSVRLQRGNEGWSRAKRDF